MNASNSIHDMLTVGPWNLLRSDLLSVRSAVSFLPSLLGVEFIVNSFYNSVSSAFMRYASRGVG